MAMEQFKFTPKDSVKVIKKIREATPSEILETAADITVAFRKKGASPKPIFDRMLEELQKTDSLDQQTRLLTFAFSLEKNGDSPEQTRLFLDELATTHEYTDEFSEPFKRFIDKRLRIADASKSQPKIGDPAAAREVLSLLKTNGDFFHDILDLQEHFSRNISPIMPLNSTWNPLLTDAFKVKGSKGLWFIYANNKRDDYIRLMKQQMSSEWTGFNRFVEEPWDEVKNNINKDGNLIDIGSSIGISAVEIAQTLNMNGSVVLLDFHNPLRTATSLRITDYANPHRKLIPLPAAMEKMDELRGDRVLISLFGVDISKPLPRSIESITDDAALVHCANVLPYLPPEKRYQSIQNALQMTSTQGGVLKIHNDESLPIDNVLFSLCLQKNSDSLKIIPSLIKGKF